MLENLLVPALVVVILWVIILGIYLAVSRRQPDVSAELRALENQLDRVEGETGQR